VFDLAEVIHGYFERRVDFVMKIAKVVVAIPFKCRKRWKLWLRCRRFHPNNSVTFPHHVSSRLRVKLGSAWAPTGALAIEGPAVVQTLKPVVDHFSHAQLHAPVWTRIPKSANLSRSCSKEHNVGPVQANGYRITLQLVRGENGMPVIEFW
jgi:hypothetical protein